MAKSLKISSDSERYVPLEVIFMMLVTLPTKILLQMRSEWRNIISDRRFIKAHFDRENGIHNNSLERYMDDARWMRCIGFEDPGTRLLRQFSDPYVFRDELRNFALGYDSTTSAYKVVRILGFTGGKLRSHPKMGFRSPGYDNSFYDVTTARVYNCKTEIWDEIEHFPYVIFNIAQGVTINGAPHWVMSRDHFGKDEVIDLVIVYFDLVEDKFKKLPKPDWLDHSSIFEYGVYEGQLCFIHYTEPEDELWVIQKQGETWINLSSIVDISVRHPGWCSYEPLDPRAFKGTLYVESLVSPFRGDENHDIG